MIQARSIDISSNNFSFSIKTSSGDNISLSMYDNKELDFSKESGSGYKKESLSLKHELGYSFRYSGNGIDENDKKEIEEAMKIIRPMYHKFLENIEKNDPFRDSKKEITNLSNKIRDILPSPQNKKSQNLLKFKVADEMDELLKSFKQNQKLLEESKKLFDKIFKTSDIFELYA